MDISRNSTIFLIFTLTITLSSLLPISISHESPSPSPSANDVSSSSSPSISPSSSDAASPSASPSGDDVSSSSPSTSPSSSSSDASSTLTTSPSSSPSSGDDVSSSSPSSGDAVSPSSGDDVSSSSPSGETESSSTTSTTTTTSSSSSDSSSSSSDESSAPAPSPDSSYPSFPTMFSTKFERRMEEVESGSSMRTNPTNLVKELCSGVENPGKCMEFFRDSRSEDPAEIIATEIGTLKTLVKEGISAATKVRSRQDGSEAVTHCLDVCLENYDKAMSNLDKATATCSRCIRANPKCTPKETGEVKTMLSAAISNVGFCDESFNAQGLPDPPMKATNDAVVELTDWLLEFCKKLDQKY